MITLVEVVPGSTVVLEGAAVVTLVPPLPPPLPLPVPLPLPPPEPPV